jgi:hypothetical protein
MVCHIKRMRLDHLGILSRQLAERIQFSGWRLQARTRPPSAAYCLESFSPIPRLAPVINAVFILALNFIDSFRQPISLKAGIKSMFGLFFRPD